MCYVFGLIVLTPTLFSSQAKHFTPANMDENREKQALPAASKLVQQPFDALCELRTYYNENFPFREAAIATDSALRFQGLGVEWKNRVSMGSDGWLFLRETRQHAPVSLPAPDFTDDELEAWIKVFRDRQAAAEANGAEYVVVIAPNKATIYRDKRPSTLAHHQPDSRLQALQSAMTEQGISFVDLVDVLTEARREVPDIYYRTDTHWNAIGAKYAAQEILSNLNIPTAASLSTDRFNDGVTEETEPFTGDLLRLLGAVGFTREHWVKCEPTDGFSWQRRDFSHDANSRVPDYMQAFATEIPNSNLPRTLVFRDSFTLDLQPFLSEGFSRAVYVWGYSIDVDVVEAEQPDVVLDVFVERRLTSPTPPAFKADCL